MTPRNRCPLLALVLLYTAQSVQAQATTIRINVGGSSFTDHAGNFWEADHLSYHDNADGEFAKCDNDILQTQDDALYCTGMKYKDNDPSFVDIPIPTPGDYQVTLLFTDYEKDKAGDRVFDVSLEGKLVFGSLDIAANTGDKYVALQKTATTTVLDGVLTVQFDAIENKPLLSAIEIVSLEKPEIVSQTTPAPPATIEAIRINVGGSSYTDGAGHVWAADRVSYHDDNVDSEFQKCDNDILQTQDDALYCTGIKYKDSDPSFVNVPVPTPGDYQVTLLFTDYEKDKAGDRLFDVSLEGKRVFAGLDIAGLTGDKYVALQKTATTTVLDGVLTVQFDAIENKPLLSAIEIVSLGQPAPPNTIEAIRINTGGSGYTDSQGHVWAADRVSYHSNVDGEFAKCDNDILQTQDDTLYCTGIKYKDNDPSFLRIPVPLVGDYQVTLMFTDYEKDKAQERLFDVSLENKRVFTRLDIAGLTGDKYVALQKTATTTVLDGALTVQFDAIENKPLLSAIEIVYLVPPTESPTVSPSSPPTMAPSGYPSSSPTSSPTDQPSASPTDQPTANPTGFPSQVPTNVPTVVTTSPSEFPTSVPTMATDAPVDSGENPQFEPVPVYRINSGSYEFIDKLGFTWSTDIYNSGGGSYVVEADIAIEDTENDALYHSEVNGDFSYSLSVEDGNYEIILHFAELFHQSEGARVFDIDLEGKTVLEDLDLVAELGDCFISTRYTFYRSITDGSIDIACKTVKDKCKINGVEVIRQSDDFQFSPTAAPVTSSPSPVVVAQINCGSFEYEALDGSGIWASDTIGTYGGAFAVAPDTQIKETDNDALYHSELYGNVNYMIPVTAGKTYEIILHFCELYHQSEGARVFQVLVEEEVVEEGLDLVAELGGPFIATQKAYTRTIPDDFINIALVSLVDNGKISGIQVIQLD